jgi:hypothetical protein
MHRGSDVWATAGWLGMSYEVLVQVYGHHHPDFQQDVAERMSGQRRDRNTMNKSGQTATDTPRIINISGANR